MLLEKSAPPGYKFSRRANPRGGCFVSKTEGASSVILLPQAGFSSRLLANAFRVRGGAVELPRSKFCSPIRTRAERIDVNVAIRRGCHKNRVDSPLRSELKRASLQNSAMKKKPTSSAKFSITAEGSKTDKGLLPGRFFVCSDPSDKQNTNQNTHRDRERTHPCIH